MEAFEVEDGRDSVCVAQVSRSVEGSIVIRASQKRGSIAEAALTFAGIDEDEVESRGGLTSLEVTMSLVTSIIGAGVVALPGLMESAGWILGPAITIFTGICFMEVGTFLHDAIGAADRSRSVKIKSFDDFGYVAMGQIGVTMVQSSVTTFYTGAMIVFLVLMSKNILILLPMGVCEKPSLTAVMICLCPVACMLAMLKDLKMVAKLMPIGAFVSFGACGLIIVQGLMDAQQRQKWSAEELASLQLFNLWPEELSNLGTVIAVLFAAFAIMGTVPTIRGQMKNRSEFPKAFRTAIGIVMVLYVSCMVCGYYGYGNFIQDNVVQSMERFPMNVAEARAAVHDNDMTFTGPESPVMGKIMALMVVINLMVSFPVFFQCVFASLLRMLGLTPENAPWIDYATPANIIARVMIIVACTVVGVLVPYFLSLLAILAAVCSTFNNALFPLFFSYKVHQHFFQLSLGRKIFHGTILLLATTCLILGLIDSVGGLIAKFNSHPELDPCKNMTANVTAVVA